MTADAETANSLMTLLFGTTAGGGALGYGIKIFMDRYRGDKANGDKPAPAVPHAKNGFMTLSEIDQHCIRQQEICKKMIAAEFAVIQTRIDARLDRADKQFDAIGARLDEIASQIKDMKGRY